MWPSMLCAGGRNGQRFRWLPWIAIALACLAGQPAHALEPALRLQDYHHATWTAAQGAPTIVTTMARTCDDWLWLGMTSGLYRFDDVTFSKFASTDGSAPLGTWCCLALCALVVLALVIALVHWRTRYMARRIAERFQERLAERERIARALHDSLLQNIQGLILRLHAALKPLPKGGEVRANIESILDQADAIMKEAREELLDLRTGPGKGVQDLGHALATFGQSLQEQFGPRFRMLVTGEARPLTTFAWHELYLIGREALFNAYQHARASNVEVELVYGCDSFALFIRDDGRGMDESIHCGEGRTRHWGLAGMKERAQGLDGALELWSRQRAGTELVVRTPGQAAYAPADRPDVKCRMLALLARLPP